MPDTTTETAAAVDSAHQPEPWYHEVGSDECPHGAEPDDNTPEHDAWEDATSERHQPSGQGITICLDAPAGDVCEECSNDVGEAVPWSACETRRHAHPKPGTEPTPEAHEPVEVWVGTGDCLERRRWTRARTPAMRPCSGRAPGSRGPTRAPRRARASLPRR